MLIDAQKHIKPYEDRLVAFFDYQGFKDDIIKNYPAEAIGTVFSDVLHIKKLAEKDYPFIEITIISDSIVISSTVIDDEKLLAFFELCAYVALPKIGKLENNKCIEKYIAVRGGIAYGQLHHKDNIVFGPALIDAYSLSEKSPSGDLQTTMNSDTFMKLTSNQFRPFLGDVTSKLNDCSYTFEPWLFKFYIINSTKEKDFDSLIYALKTYHDWVISNVIANIDTTRGEHTSKLLQKYLNLSGRTSLTFSRIKDNYYNFFSLESKGIVDKYSNIDAIFNLIESTINSNDVTKRDTL